MEVLTAQFEQGKRNGDDRSTSYGETGSTKDDDVSSVSSKDHRFFVPFPVAQALNPRGPNGSNKADCINKADPQVIKQQLQRDTTEKLTRRPY